jgi:hypothetical protein
MRDEPVFIVEEEAHSSAMEASGSVFIPHPSSLGLAFCHLDNSIRTF